MANVSNAYQALLGAGESVSTSKKKKNQNKNKGKKETEDTVVNDAPAPESKQSAPQQQQMTAVDVSEATAILERAAREAKAMTDKCRLWKDWVRQGTDRSGKGMKYKTSDGLLLDFKQVLLRSKALEITVESSLVSGMGHEHHDNLAQLFSAFISQGSALASQLVRLAALLVDEAPDTRGAAQRAVHSVISALKSGSEELGHGNDQGPVSTWLSRISDVDKDIAKQQGMLQKLAGSSGGVVTKEQLNCAKAIYKLSEEKFDLLQPKNIPTAKAGRGAGDATSKALDELKTVINSHLKEATALEDSVKTKANSAEAQRAQSLAAYRREESIVAQESQEVAAQVRTLEAQLRALKSRQVELDEKRAQLQQRSRMVMDSMGSSRPLGGALSAAHYKDEMAVVQALGALANPGQQSAPEQILVVQSAQVNTPVEYIAHGQQYLTLALASLVELPTKLNFCKQRLSHADKLMKLVPGGNHAKQKEEVEKLLAEHMKAADDIKRACMQVVNDLNQRYDIIVKTAPDQMAAAAEQLHMVDQLSTQIRAAYDAVHVAHDAPLVEAPPPASTGRRGPARDAAAANGGEAKAASTPAAAAVLSAAAAAAAPAAAPAAVAAAPAAAAAPPRQPVAPGRQWGRVQAATPSDADSSLPTPAEAFKAAAAAEASTSSDTTFKEVAPKKNRKKA